jgi:predicted dehydrogenase
MPLRASLPTSRIPPPADAPALRWGILGTGWIAEQFISSVRAHTAQRFVAVGSRTPARGEAFAQKFGIPKAYASYEDLVSAGDIDVVYVETPHNAHHRDVMLALDHGKHVLVEKPIALNRAQAAELVDKARRVKCFLGEALWTFFLPKFDVLRQLLAAGAVGDIKSVYTDYGEYLPPGHRIFEGGLAGGPLLDLGTYPVAVLTEILG